MVFIVLTLCMYVIYNRMYNWCPLDGMEPSLADLPLSAHTLWPPGHIRLYTCISLFISSHIFWSVQAGLDCTRNPCIHGSKQSLTYDLIFLHINGIPEIWCYTVARERVARPVGFNMRYRPKVISKISVVSLPPSLPPPPTTESCI
jgi:hypothetical protein